MNRGNQMVVVLGPIHGVATNGTGRVAAACGRNQPEPWGLERDAAVRATTGSATTGLANAVLSEQGVSQRGMPQRGVPDVGWWHAAV